MKKLAVMLLIILFIGFGIALTMCLTSHAHQTEEQMILDEILPQYEWEVYAYDIREITKVPADGKKYYAATFYTGDGKYEFLIVVDGDDVDEELIKEH